MKDEDVIYGLAALFIAAALFFFALAVWAIVWFMLSAIIALITYLWYRREAGQEFDTTARELGVDLPADDMLRSMGIDVSQNGRIKTAADWMAGTPLGVTDEWDG